jgi:ABC-type enterobactin transport system permease subunit
MKSASGISRSQCPASSTNASHSKTSNSVVKAGLLWRSLPSDVLMSFETASSSRMKTWICGSLGSKSGASVTCCCSCCVSTQWYVLHLSTNLQLMQMHACTAGVLLQNHAGLRCGSAVRLTTAAATAEGTVTKSHTKLAPRITSREPAAPLRTPESLVLFHTSSFIGQCTFTCMSHVHRQSVGAI